MINKNYQFFCNYDGNQLEVFPINETFVFSQQKEEGQRFARKKIGQKFTFCGDDFQHFYALENSCDRCDNVQLEIVPCCGGDSYFGRVMFNDSDFDPDSCTAEIAINPEDEYSCIFDNWEVKKNILEIPDKQIVCATIGIKGFQECTDQSVAPLNVPVDCTTGNGWTLILHRGQTIAGSNLVDRLTRWCREEITSATQPPGGGWINEGGNLWVRPIVVRFDSLTDQPNLYSVGFTPVFPTNGEIDNGVTLKDVLEFFADDCGLGIVSDFFNINPDNTAPLNSPYLCAKEFLQCLVLYQATDVLTPYTFQNATIANKCFKKVLTDLLKIYNLEWWIENGNIRIEHVTYSNEVEGTDLTDAKYIECLAGKREYSYLKDSLVRSETFNWDKKASPAFDGVPIFYPECTEENQSEPTEIECLYTDIQHALTNRDSFSTDGVYMVSTVDFNGKKALQSGSNIPGFPEGYLNSALSWPVLHECYHKDDRLQFTGLMNGNPTTFNSAKRVKVSPPIEIPFTCEEYEAFEFTELMKNEWGWGEVVEATYDACTCYLSVRIANDGNCNCFLPCDGQFKECSFPIWDRNPCHVSPHIPLWEINSLVIGGTTYIDNTNVQYISFDCVNETMELSGGIPVTNNHVDALSDLLISLGAPLSVRIDPNINGRILFKFPECEPFGISIIPIINVSDVNDNGSYFVSGMSYNHLGAIEAYIPDSEGDPNYTAYPATGAYFDYLFGDPNPLNCTITEECI